MNGPRRSNRARLVGSLVFATVLILPAIVVAAAFSHAAFSAPGAGRPGSVVQQPNLLVSRPSPTLLSRAGAAEYSPHGTATGPPTNPYDYHTHEPAPMGIADYAVEAAGAGAYWYNTSAVRGVATYVSNTAVSNASLPGSVSADYALQLNAMYAFGIQNTYLYVYWIQDVVLINSSSNQVVFVEDNIWNNTGDGDIMFNSTVVGNGTVSSTSSGSALYYDVANSSLPGSHGVSVAAPAELSLEMDAFEVDGTPAVAFSYFDGFGQVVYDVVDFPWATAVDPFYGVIVDGEVRDPVGSPYDLEFIMGGPGGGRQTTDVSSEMNFRLLYYNGHNFEAPLNAFNFGSQTAEGADEVQAVGMYAGADGNISSHLTNGDSSNSILVQMYNSSRISILNVSDPAATTGNAVLTVGGQATTFTGGLASLVLHPGVYDVNVTVNGDTTPLGWCQLNASMELEVSPSSACASTPPPSATTTGSSGNPTSYLWLVALVAVAAVVAVVVVVLVRRRAKSGPSAPVGPYMGSPPAGAVNGSPDPYSQSGPGALTVASGVGGAAGPAMSPSPSATPGPAGTSEPTGPATSSSLSPGTPGSSIAGPPCPRCGAPLMYVAQYSRWYCTREQTYL